MIKNEKFRFTRIPKRNKGYETQLVLWESTMYLSQDIFLVQPLSNKYNLLNFNVI